MFRLVKPSNGHLIEHVVLSTSQWEALSSALNHRQLTAFFLKIILLQPYHLIAKCDNIQHDCNSFWIYINTDILLNIIDWLHHHIWFYSTLYICTNHLIQSHSIETCNQPASFQQTLLFLISPFCHSHFCSYCTCEYFAVSFLEIIFVWLKQSTIQDGGILSQPNTVSPVAYRPID